MSETFKKDKLYALKNEIIMARKLNEKELEPIIQESVQRYVGSFVPGMGGDWDIVLNEVYPIIQNNLPSIFFRNPRAFLKPRNKTFIAKKRNPVTGEMEEMQIDSAKSAKTQEDILNYSLLEMKYKKECQKVLLDALMFPFGVMWHGYKGDFGMTEEQSVFIKNDRPFVKRISPLRFIKDPSVNMSNIEEARWVGRIIDVPLEDLVEDDKLDVDKNLIKGFKGYGEMIGTADVKTYMQSGGSDMLRINAARRQMIEFADKGYQDSKDAKFVTVYEIYYRPSKKEAREGKKGWILLLTDEQDKPLRVNDWKVKAEGFPSKILEFNPLLDSMFGISDIETYKSIADQKNIIVNLQLRNAQENSKVWVALAKNGTNEEEIEHIQRGDQSIVIFEGDSIAGKMAVQSPGGQASSELYLIDQRIQKNLEDKSGVTDLKRGFLQSGEESAASVKIRAAGGGARPAYRQDIMSDFLKDSFHYINQVNKQFMPYTDAVRIVGSLDLEWSENPSKEEIQADTDVEIDVFSMLPENPETEIQQLQTILQLMVTAISTPAIVAKLQQENKTFNLSPILEQMLLRLKLRNPDIFRTIKPEESMGVASVQQLKQAQANVEAALHAQQLPFPPQPEDDHAAKLGIYMPIVKLLGEAGQQNTQAFEMLMQVIQIQQALLAQKEEKEGGQAGQSIKLTKPSVRKI